MPPLGAVWAAFVRDWPETWRGRAASGLLPLGLAGALLPRAWPFLRRYGYAWRSRSSTPFAAWAYVGDPRVIFFGKNAERVLVYALPFLLALALHLADRLRGAPPAVPARGGPAAPPWSTSRSARPRSSCWRRSRSVSTDTAGSTCARRATARCC